MKAVMHSTDEMRIDALNVERLKIEDRCIRAESEIGICDTVMIETLKVGEVGFNLELGKAQVA
jgi:hypothetical protein